MTQRSPILHGFQLLRRYPWLSLLPLGFGTLAWVVGPGEAPASWWSLLLHEPFPVVGNLSSGTFSGAHWALFLLGLVIQILLTAGFLHLIFAGLRGEAPSAAGFVTGVARYGLRYLAATVLLALLMLPLVFVQRAAPTIALALIVVLGLAVQLWKYTITAEEPDPVAALKLTITRLVKQIGFFWAPLLLNCAGNLLFTWLFWSAAAGGRWVALVLYPVFGTLVTASVAAAYLQALGEEPTPAVDFGAETQAG